MTLRRDFLSMAAAGTVLPIVARAGDMRHVDAKGSRHPEADLIAICHQHKINRDAVNSAPAGMTNNDPLWDAYDYTRDAISAARPRTIEGLQAKARVIMAQGLWVDGEYVADNDLALLWAWDLARDILAVSAVA